MNEWKKFFLYNLSDPMMILCVYIEDRYKSIIKIYFFLFIHSFIQFGRVSLNFFSDQKKNIRSLLAYKNNNNNNIIAIQTNKSIHLF